MSTTPGRTYDLIVFGATGFVGQILCRYLNDRYGSDGDLNWAIAGRNPDKLASVSGDLGLSVDHMVADTADDNAVRSLAESTRVVVSTVGPYSIHGSPLVRAAVAAGTDYCDLAGETHWMQAMIDAHQDSATRTGARVVHSCGFDSIPSDLGVFFTQQRSLELLGEQCNQISMRVKAMRGGPSGGTIASMLNVIDDVSENPELRQVLANPYALAPMGMRTGVRQLNVTLPMRDEASRRWVAPFVMAGVNSRIVHRSHALQGRPWGDDFLYDEATLTGSGPVGAAKAGVMAGGLGAALAAISVKPIRKLLGERVLPQAGEGPSPEAQKSGFFDFRFYGTTASGSAITTRVTGDRDPGYGSTAKMLGEAAVALLHLDPADKPGGFWTPSTAFGMPLVDRLIEHAGLTFSIVN
ncbi:MAG: short subunit dehydrogenase-like uncharacterized protein [Verrucomicrobiales bacterium]|jgi:short subunit dehydrogenase-like uncharacterized protein